MHGPDGRRSLVLLGNIANIANPATRPVAATALGVWSVDAGAVVVFSFFFFLFICLRARQLIGHLLERVSWPELRVAAPLTPLPTSHRPVPTGRPIVFDDVLLFLFVKSFFPYAEV